MSDVYLAVIALGVAVMAAIQVAAVVLAVRAIRRLDAIAGRLERELQPVLVSLQALSADAARATALATGQVERADRVVNDLATRLEEAVTAFRSAAGSFSRDGSWVAGLTAILAAIRDLRQSPPRPRPEGEDALFI